MNCRPHCGACCIAPSISSPLPDLPQGKPAGVPCPHLDENFLCQIFHSPLRPKVCSSLQPSKSMCGTCKDEALAYLERLESLTAP